MLVETAWLAWHLGDPDLVVVDMRWREDGSGRARFERGHVPGATFLDWSTDLVDPDHPVAFMLAPPERFVAVMERCGVGDGSTVVAYADAHGSGPFRLWWACRVYGHDDVRVLDGGFRKWVAEGRPVSAEPPPVRAAASRWTPRFDQSWVAGAEDVAAGAAAADGPRTVVLDSRPRGRVATLARHLADVHRALARRKQVLLRDRLHLLGRDRGEATCALVGVVRIARGADGHSDQELRELFAAAGATAEAASRAVTYCGVGISASALAFALTLAGFDDVAV